MYQECARTVTPWQPGNVALSLAGVSGLRASGNSEASRNFLPSNALTSVFAQLGGLLSFGECRACCLNRSSNITVYQPELIGV